MAASDSPTQLDTTGDGRLPDDRGFATSLGGEDVVAGDHDLGSKPRFECPHCRKSFTTKKIVNRHLTATMTVCAKRHAAQADTSTSRPKSTVARWICSRCGKDCVSFHSVERHIERSCWRSCDECAAEGIARCDSVSKIGPCRSCESKERACTKHASAITGSVPQPWTGPAAQPQQASPTNEEVTTTTQQNPNKRKTPTSPKTSPEDAHKSKRRVSSNQPIVDYGMDRLIDPLGGQAHVPPTERREGVSNWLQEQSRDESSSTAAGQAQMRDDSPLLSQASSMQMRRNSQQPGPSHNLGGALPVHANARPFQHNRDMMMPHHGQGVHCPSLLHTHQNMGRQSAYSPLLSNLPDLPPFGGVPLSAPSGPVQFDVFRQMEATHQQNEAHDYDMAMRFGPHNGMSLPPPFGPSGSLTLSNGPHMAQYQGLRNTPLSLAVTSVALSSDPSVLTLRIHSNTHDTNGQPIFSILRIGRDQAFGPRLDAYCANRGKEYGVHWMFVYRYQVREQQMQITLTWDMTPNDVKDEDVPGMTIQNLDTIYVMRAKPLPSGEMDRELTDGGAVQFPGPQVSHEVADIIDGETSFYQNPDVSRQWYQAVEHDSTRLRAGYGKMKAALIKAQQQIHTKDNHLILQKKAIDDLTFYSSQLRGPTHLPPPKPTAIVPGLPNAQAPAGRVVRQRPEPPPQQQPSQQRAKADPSAFVAKCEAVRDPQVHAPQHLQPLQFPSFSGESTGADYTHHPNLNPSYSIQAQHQSPVYDAADKVAAEQGTEKMEE